MNVQKRQLNTISQIEEIQTDVFICSASFEERSCSIAKHLTPENIKCAFIVRHSTLLHTTSASMDFLCEHFFKTQTAELNTDNPIQIEDTLADNISRLAQEYRSYVVDITTFTRESLLILLNQMRQFLQSSDRVSLAYTCAGDYSGGNIAEDMWLSHGVRQIRSVAGFPGELLPSQPLHLIVLAGFEDDRATRLIEQYEPHFLSIGHGLKETSVSDEHYEANLHFAKKIKAFYPNSHSFEFPPADPFGTQIAIENQAHSFQGASVVIAPLNTKIATVGVALAAFANPSLQICYAQADLYNFENYSTAGNSFYLFDIDLTS